MATRRRRGRGSGGRDIRPRDWWIVVAVAVVILLVIVGARTLLVPKPDRDPETDCPETGPEALIAILVDVTDEVDAISRADVLGHLAEYVDSGRKHEMFLAYEAKPVGKEIGEPLLMLCHPGDPEEASELTENRRLIRRRLERFERRFEGLLDELLGREEAPKSPLMENVQSVAVSFLGREEYANIDKRLILVSDLMQHSESLSFFRQPADYAAFATTTAARALRTDLGGTEVEVLFLRRPVHQGVDEIGLVDFWRRWIGDQGGVLNRVVPIAGMN